MADAHAVIAELPDWLKWGANAALFVATIIATVLAIRKGEGSKDKEHREHDEHDPADLLKADPVLGFLEAIRAIADNMRLQTEAQKTIAAALVTHAKLIETDFNELRVFKAVRDQLDAEVERRARWDRARPSGPPPHGWGGE